MATKSKKRKIWTWVMIIMGGYMMIGGVGVLFSTPKTSSMTGVAIFDSLIIFALGVPLLYFGIKRLRREKLFKKYLDYIQVSGETSIAAIAEALDVSKAQAMSDIQMAIDKGFLDATVNRKKGIILLVGENGNAGNHTGGYRMVTVKCKNCGAEANIPEGKVAECEYCGSPVQG